MTEPPDRPAGQWTPAGLGVHQAIGGGPPPQAAKAAPLSAYVRRPHDERLRAVLDPATEYSRLVVIRGDALTGTSRTIYEAVTDVLADWVVEHPPAVAALAARLEAGIAPRTVLWLGELRHYADADGGAAVLDHLNDLLDDDGRVIALATIWPGYWDSYTAAAAAGLGAAEPAAVVGRLLARLDVLAEYDLTSHDPAYGGVVDVPDRFTPEEMVAAAEAGDPALAAAAAAAGPDGPVIQYLAGARDLLARYDGPGTDPCGSAIITAAMDASRLGHAGPLPAALLRDAAVGYLADPDRPVGHFGEWDTALAWAADSGWALQPVPPTAAGDGTPGYRVAGYLDQHGRRTRAGQPGPASLWDALAAHTRSPDDLGRLAQAAQDRGLYRHAATAWTAAAAAGRTDAAARLITHLGVLAEPAETARAARWAVSQASLDDPWNVARLLEGLRAAGAGDAVQALLARDPAGQVGLGHQWDVVELLRALRAAGAAEVARALVVRVAGQVSLTNPRYLARLLRALREAGAAEALRELASRTASQADAEATQDVVRLLDGLHAAGAADAIRTLATRAVDAVDVEDPYGVAELLNALRAVGADEEVRALLARDPGRHVSLDRTGGVADLLGALHAAGAGDAFRVLAARAAAEVSLKDGEYDARLLRVLSAADAGDAIQVMLARDPAGHASLVFPEDVAQLLEALHAVGAEAAVRALAARLAEQDLYFPWYAPEPARALHNAGASEMLRVLSAQAVADVPIDDPEAVAGLLEELRGAGSAEAIQALLDRDPAAQVGVEDPWEVARLLGELRAVGTGDAVGALASRAVRGVSLDQPGIVARLLEALRAAGLQDAVRALASRAAHGASLHDPQEVARLLDELRRTGAGDAVQTLLARDPSRQLAMDASQPFRPDRQWAVARLLVALREAGAAEAVRTLALRAADAGMFGLFLEARPDEAATYRFGREPDGTPSPPWTWSEPDSVSGSPN
ncbi:MAG TPA: hypothetical protein VJ418_21315 [Streptosporangiaceae bacterium]|nr:hypothetical protein [Streptosporangiaceae bacterium]